jgi:hypothetical protein
MAHMSHIVVIQLCLPIPLENAECSGLRLQDGQSCKWSPGIGARHTDLSLFNEPTKTKLTVLEGVAYILHGCSAQADFPINVTCRLADQGQVGGGIHGGHVGI